MIENYRLARKKSPGLWLGGYAEPARPRPLPAGPFLGDAYDTGHLERVSNVCPWTKSGLASCLVYKQWVPQLCVLS